MRLIIYLLLLYIVPTISHEHGENCGCPLHKKKNIPEYIPDPNDTIPPDVCSKGQARYIPDPTSTKPDYWDDDDDGPWEPELVKNPEYTWQPRMIPNPEYIPPKPDTYRNKVVGNVQEAIPWVTLGILLISIISIIPLPLEDFLRNQLSSESNGIMQSMKAGVLGLATPLCSCGSLPIASGLIDYGIPISSVVTFLTASQSAGIDSALITYGLLGPKAAIGRLVGALILSIVSGMILQSGTKPSNLNNSKKEAKISETTSSTSIILRFMASLIDTTTSIVPLIFLGIAISTAATSALPRVFTSPNQTIKENHWESPYNDFFLRIIIIFSSLPLQLCEHTTAALASNLFKSGFASAGLSFAFLLTAPATNLPTLLLLAKKGQQSSSVSSIQVAVILSCTALIFSYIVDLLHIDLGVDKGVVGGDMAALPHEFVIASPYIIGFFMICGMLRFMQSKLVKKGDSSCCKSNCSEKKVQ